MLNLLRSIRFNVILFLVIAVISAIGTLLPQQAIDASKVAIFKEAHPQWGAIFQTLGFFEIYYTVYFSFLLGLMALNVVVCKLAKRPPDTGLVPLRDDSKEDVTLRSLEKKPHRLSGMVTQTLSDLEAELKTHLEKQSYGVQRISLKSGAVALLATRHSLQRWGSHLSHLSIVVILLGGLLKSLLGFDTMVPVLEGRSNLVTESLMEQLSQRPDISKHPVWGRLQAFWYAPSEIHKRIQRWSIRSLTSWTLRVDKMIVEFYPGTTTPNTFGSHIQLFNGSEPLAATTIRVNQPLNVRGVRFFQASWGVTGMIDGVTLQLKNKQLQLSMKGEFAVPDAPWKGRVEHYLPNFTVDEEGKASTVNLEWKNPYLVIGLYNNKKIEVAQMALPAPSPAIPSVKDRSSYLFYPGGVMPIDPPIQVLQAKPKLFSGVQVSYDPGFWLITTGVVAMLVGLGMLFYLHRRSISIILEPSTKQKSTHVEIGGWSSRGEKMFKSEFDQLFRSFAFKKS